MSKGQRIKMYREAIHLSQVELAERIGVSKQTLYKYENDIITNIPSDKIEAIARETNTTPEMIMGWAYQNNTFVFSPHEKTIVIHYRSADPGTQASVRKLLDVADPATPLHLIPVAAHEHEGATPEELAEDVDMVENDKI